MTIYVKSVTKIAQYSQLSMWGRRAFLVPLRITGLENPVYRGIFDFTNVGLGNPRRRGIVISPNTIGGPF